MHVWCLEEEGERALSRVLWRRRGRPGRINVRINTWTFVQRGAVLCGTVTQVTCGVLLSRTIGVQVGKTQQGGMKGQQKTAGVFWGGGETFQSNVLRKASSRSRMERRHCRRSRLAVRPAVNSSSSSPPLRWELFIEASWERVASSVSVSVADFQGKTSSETWSRTGGWRRGFTWSWRRRGVTM